MAEEVPKQPTEIAAPGAPRRWAKGDPPKPLERGRTVCNERNEKNKLCNGHVKQLHTGGQAAGEHLRGNDVLYKCQTCGALYVGAPLGHLRDPAKQSRFVQKELTEILQAAGGTLPFYGDRKLAHAPQNSSAAADAHRPAAEAQAATGQASPAPLSPAASPASPVAGPEEPGDLAPAPANERSSSG